MLLNLTKRCRWFEFITPSTLALQPLLELLLQPASHEHRDVLQLGLQEALVNAVRHGNGNDPAKLVRIRRIHSPQWLIWQVQDQGPGLQPEQRRIRHIVRARLSWGRTRRARASRHALTSALG